jgi:hypothetical protein
MDEGFAKKVRDAAIAGWWTIAIVAAFLTVQWVAWLVILSAKPSWMAALWGPDTSWSTIQTVVLWCVAVFKICLWVMAAVVVWLSLWARRLRR